VGEMLRLKASDGHELGAYRAEPEEKARGGVVVLQEIFGVNSHIRAVCDRLAAQGFIAIAPALFDRFQRDFVSGYSAEEIATAISLMKSLDWDVLLLDTRAAHEALRAEANTVSVVGFCLGGSLAYLAATRFSDLGAAICYYGGMIVNHADTKPLCPVMMHFGESDHSISMRDVESVRAKRLETEIHTYPAGHGFNCDERNSFNPEQAALAWSRTMALLDKVQPQRP